MIRRLLVLAALAAFLAPTPAAASRRRLLARPAIACTAVEGIPAVGVSVDGGLSMLPHLEPYDDFAFYTFGLAVTADPRVLVAVAGRLLLRSDDAGCRWTIDSRIVFPQELARVTPLPDGRVLAWSILGPELYRIGDSIETMTLPTTAPLELWASAGDPRLLAVSDTTGASWWSDDGGTTWTPRPILPSTFQLYAFAFDPADRRHAVAGLLAEGARVTFDGGASWQAAAGIAGFNVFRIAISPVDPMVVWAIVLDRAIPDRNRRSIVVSVDGGLTFGVVVRESDDLQLTNGFAIAPHPTDASLLWFALAGTDLILVDRDGAIRRRARLPYRDVNAFAFSPLSRDIVYLGLKQSQMTASQTTAR